MPVALHTTVRHAPHRALRWHDHRPTWVRVQDDALEATDEFAAFWSGLIRDVRETVSLEEVETALDDLLALEALTVVTMAWHRAAEVPARETLPPLVTSLLVQSGAVVTAQVATVAGTAFALTPRMPDIAQWIQQYSGSQIQGITATTLRAVRGVLRDGWQAQTPPSVLAQQLHGMVGLTPRQARQVATLRARLMTQGQSATQVHRAVQEATAHGLRLRALQIAQTETQAITQEATRQAWVQAANGGLLARAQVRRRWITAGGNVCERCAAIPSLNLHGVGLDEPFIGANGLTPPLHVSCRCSVETSLI